MCTIIWCKNGPECVESARSVADHALKGDCIKCHCGLDGIAGEKTQDLILDVAYLKSDSKSHPERLPGVIKSLFPDLHGRDWLRSLPKADRLAFSYLGRTWALNGKSGGLVRSLTGRRDERGRFIG
jgi:hypothetical protein